MPMIRVSDSTHKKVKSLADKEKVSMDSKINSLYNIEKRYMIEYEKTYNAMSDEERRIEDMRKTSRNEFYLQRDIINALEIFNDDREFTTKDFLFERLNGRYHNIDEKRCKEIIDTAIYPLLEDWKWLRMILRNFYPRW